MKRVQNQHTSQTTDGMRAECRLHAFVCLLIITQHNSNTTYAMVVFLGATEPNQSIKRGVPLNELGDWRLIFSAQHGNGVTEVECGFCGTVYLANVLKHIIAEVDSVGEAMDTPPAIHGLHMRSTNVQRDKLQ